jgi:hypothetical protein
MASTATTTPITNTSPPPMNIIERIADLLFVERTEGPLCLAGQQR